MPIWDGAGQASGAGTLAGGAGSLHIAAGGSAPGGSGSTPATPTLFVGPGGVAAGLAGGQADANLVGVLAGLAAGAATVLGDYRPNGSGQASGFGLLADASGQLIHGGTGTAAGTGQATGTAGLVLIVTGIVHGQSELDYDYFVDSDGTTGGVATVTGSGLRIVVAQGRIAGTSLMVFSYPLPIFGQGTLTGMPVVDHVPPPISAIVGPPKCFRYLQHFQRGDLPIYISNHAGPVSPVRVVYTLFQVRPDGSRRQVGPAHRKPVQGVVGEFYATGRAGESGQPGVWVIVWEFQRTFQSAIQCKEMCFQVLDAVLATDPRDVTPRCRKYGWN